MKQHNTLYEFGNWTGYNGNLEELEKQLQEIWETRKEERVEKEEEILTENENEEEVKKKDFQPFLSFNYKKEIRARNWVGFIQSDKQLIEIYPKVFKANPPSKKDMLQHIFFWLQYCSKQRFPHTKARLETWDIDSFPELIIYLIASHLKEILEEKPLSLYQEIEERMQKPRGRLNFQRYINNSLVTGQWHQMECDHEPFLFDNTVNRVIKYCARLLEQQARTDSNKNLLREITFILDEVEDVPCSIYDMQKIRLNSFFEEYETALDYCKMILEQQIYSSESYEMHRWTMLFPMELLFEDFIAGFVKQHFSDKWKVAFQKGEMYVVNEPEAFKMKHDIFLEEKENDGKIKDKGKKIIIDTKYKLRISKDLKEKKGGVAQADIYQMITYAYKRECEEVILIYPGAINNKEETTTFKINPGKDFKENKCINIHIVKVPFWCDDGNLRVGDLEGRLKKKIEKILDQIKK